MSGDQWARLGGDAAAVYDDVLEPGMFRPWASVLVDAAAVRPGDLVLDVATGTGVVARAAAAVGADVTGLDFSADMLARAAARPDAAGVTWMEGDALGLPFADASFDAVVCAHGLQQLPDAAAAVREAVRVLRPGGRFAACVWDRIEHHPPLHALVDALERLVSLEAAENRRVPVSLGDEESLRVVAEAGGLGDIRLETVTRPTDFADVDDFTEAQLRATPLSAVGGIDDATREAVHAAVRARLGVAAGEPLRVPMGVLLLTGRRTARG